MKNRHLLLPTLLLLCLNVFSQWKYPKAKKITTDVLITYDVTYEKPLTDIQKKSTRYMRKVVVAYSNNQLIEKTYSKQEEPENIMFIDYKTLKKYETYKYSINKILKKEDLKIGNSKTFIQKGLAKNINGVICDTYYILNNEKKAYTSKKFGIRYSKHLDSEGFLLQYGGVDKYLGDYTVAATKIEYKKLPKEIFDLSEYQLKTAKELEEYNAAKRKYESSRVVKVKKVGSTIPNFAVTTIEGKKITNKSIANKVTVLNFWYTTSLESKKVIPQLNKLKAKFRGKNVDFIAVALDEKSKIIRFIQRTPYRYDIIEKGKVLANKFTVKQYPSTLVIDKKGVIKYHKTGYNPALLDALSNTITQELKK